MISQKIAPELYRRLVFVPMLSQASLQSDAVFAEFSVAFYYFLYDVSHRKRLIVPVTLEPLQMQNINERWGFLLPFRRLENNGGMPMNFDDMIKSLIQAIPGTDSDAPPPTPKPEEALPTLHPFSESFQRESSTSVDSRFLDEDRLPVYLLLDNSSSMNGEAIIAVNNGLRLLYNELVVNLQNSSRTSISIITFAHAVYSAPLVRLYDFIPPIITARTTTEESGTVLGKALQKLKETLTTDVSLREQALIFILTDGEPTDGADWYQAALELKFQFAHKIREVVVIGCGRDINRSMLETLHVIFEETGGQVLKNDILYMHELSPEKIREFFLWSAQKIQSEDAHVGGQHTADRALLLAPRGSERIE
jgi:uncharacterized protein YegL